jgi:hypothetical protein
MLSLCRVHVRAQEHAQSAERAGEKKRRKFSFIVSFRPLKPDHALTVM